MRHITAIIEYTNYNEYHSFRQTYTSSGPLVTQYVEKGYVIEEHGRFRIVLVKRTRRAEVYRILN